MAVLDELAFLAVLDELAFLAGDVFLAAVVFFAVEVDAVVFLAGAFFAVLVELAFFAGGFFAVVFLAVLDELAFLAVEVDDDFLAVVFFAAVPEEVDFDAVVLAGAAFFAVAVAPATTPATARTVGGFGMVAAVSFGSFLAPETTSLSSLPAENFGTDFFLDLIRSPVCGLRTQRALRTAFSKEPKPVIATFSPLATSRVMVSRTDSSAWAACLRFPS
ncbi:Conserved membrane hypothetical protein [metagenome]|uniref:Uncharacterized protein n=1 Tax=metagenome TaxID=256318 RepID=A0A2P2C283_9ZZZZ